MKRFILMTVAGLLVGAGTLEAQETARTRAERVLPPAVFRDVSALADQVSSSGIPDEPLFNKALEGMAKRVPPARLFPAIQAYAGRLGDARGALGPAATVPLLVAGADALRRGVSSDALGSLDRNRGRSPMAILVLAELVESGVPVDRALAVLREAMAQQAGDDRILNIPARIRNMIRNGTAPTDAADRIRRLLGTSGSTTDGLPPVPPGSEPTTKERITDVLTRPGGTG